MNEENEKPYRRFRDFVVDDLGAIPARVPKRGVSRSPGTGFKADVLGSIPHEIALFMAGWSPVFERYSGRGGLIFNLIFLVFLPTLN
jgi:hypothetical protein